VNATILHAKVVKVLVAILAVRNKTAAKAAADKNVV
jgi:hypothetical protein